MKDAFTSFVVALPSAGQTSNTQSLDFNPETAGFLTNQWRLGHFTVGIPALAGHTNTSATITFTLQDSADNGNWANTNPLIQISQAGVASTGSAATKVKTPFPPAVRRYVRFSVVASANSNTGPNSNTTYDLVV